MLKTITLDLINPMAIINIKEPLLEENFITKFDINENIATIEYEENVENYFGLSVLSAISLPLVVDYVLQYSKYKNKENEKNVILSTILGDSYYANTLLIELINFFNHNNKLKETIFFKFNMTGFDKELDLIIENYEIDNAMKKATLDIKNILKENGLNFKNFSTLEVCFDEDDCFYLETKDKTILSPETTYDVLGLEIEFEEQEDDFLTIITFCTLMINILNVKKFIIPSDCEDLYEALSQQEDIMETNVKLVLKNV